MMRKTSAGWGIAALLGGLGVATAALFAVRRHRERTPPIGHAAPGLNVDAQPGERAPAAFRPDMDAPMTAAEREALRPPPGPGPTLTGKATSRPS